jgi:hypothetical protein
MNKDLLTKLKPILWIVFFGTVAFLMFGPYNSGHRRSQETWEKAESGKAVKDRVKRKYRNHNDHLTKTFLFDSGESSTIGDFSDSLWTAVDAGDSLIKPSGTLDYLVKKADTSFKVRVKRKQQPS